MEAVHVDVAVQRRPISQPDVREIQVIFQQWKALTLDLAERFSAFGGETAQETGGEDAQDMYPLRRAREGRGWTQEDLAEQLYQVAIFPDRCYTEKIFITHKGRRRWEV